MVARVIATWRPVAWSAWSAITAAIDSRVVAVIDTRSAVHTAASARDFAHARRSSSQDSRLDHTGR